MHRSAFLAHSGIWNVDQLVVSKVKLATLLCDQIIHSGTPDPLHFAEATRELCAEPPLSGRTRTGIAESWLQVNDAIPKFEAWLGQERNLIHAREDASSRLKLATIEALLKHNFSAREHYDNYKLQSYTIAEIIYWRRHLKDSVFIGHSISDTALQILSAPIIEVEGLQEALSPVPAVLPLSWNDVFDLRSSCFYRSFREKVAELQMKGDIPNLRIHYQKGLEAIAEEVTPSVSRAATLATLSNLPIPGNPFHLAQSALEVRDQWKMAKEYGWVFFIREARSLASTDA